MQYERRWLAVVALGLSLFLSALDATIVALALPPIAQHFQLSDSLASAVTLSYAIPLTVLILPAGSSTGDLQLARRAPGRPAIRQRLSSDGRLAASSAVLVGTPGVFQQRNGRWGPLLPLTL